VIPSENGGRLVISFPREYIVHVSKRPTEGKKTVKVCSNCFEILKIGYSKLNVFLEKLNNF
jgi:hypothetical protein